MLSGTAQGPVSAESKYRLRGTAQDPVSADSFYRLSGINLPWTVTSFLKTEWKYKNPYLLVISSFKKWPNKINMIFDLPNTLFC